MADAYFGTRVVARARLVAYEQMLAAPLTARLKAARASTVAVLKGGGRTLPPDVFDLPVALTAAATWAAPAVYDRIVDNALALFRRGSIAAAATPRKIDPPRYQPDRLPGLEALIDEFGRDVVDDLADTIAEGANLGESIPKLTARVDDVIDSGTQRARLIARTETVAASNAISNGQAQLAIGDGLTLFKTWLATNDDRTRPDHVDADGQTVAFDESFDVGGESADYPGDESLSPEQRANCVLPGTRVAWSGPLVAAYRRRWVGDAYKIRTEHEDVTTVTPNHPLLTDRGWIAAQFVQVGDDLRRADIVERGTEPGVDDMPPRIEEVYRAAAEAGVEARIVGGGVHFHGDTGDGEVDVVRPNGELRDRVKSRTPDNLGDIVLVRPNVGERDLLAAGALDLPGGWLAPFGDCLLAAAGVGVGSQGGALVGAHARHADAVRFGPGAAGQPELVEPTRDDAAIDAEGLRDGEHARAAVVHRSKVVEIEVVPHDGFVFNLETIEGWYTAANLVHSNCRCVATYSTVDPVTGEDTFLGESDAIDDY